MKKLRESWEGVTKAIEELEREGRVLVIRTEGKGAAQGEGTMKTVFLDDIGTEKDPLDQGASGRNLQSFSLPFFEVLPSRWTAQ